MEDNLHRRLARVAAAIGEPARASMLCSIMDGRARTSTELATAADVSASTASAHLGKLKAADLVRLHAQGKHRYYSLKDRWVAEILESLMVNGAKPGRAFEPTTPRELRLARTCYDHMAGWVAVALHDRLLEAGWLAADDVGDSYDVTERGEKEFTRLGVDVRLTGRSRRRLAYPCLDWSERRPHLGGALGAALLEAARSKGWMSHELASRCLRVSPAGRKALVSLFAIRLPQRD
jgi:DNA-binding transcriptional ArsR family regulator